MATWSILAPIHGAAVQQMKKAQHGPAAAATKERARLPNFVKQQSTFAI
jgi:hypothetical protein